MSKVRIEIHLTKEEAHALSQIATEKGRSRKNLCEFEIRSFIAQAKLITILLLAPVLSYSQLILGAGADATITGETHVDLNFEIQNGSDTWGVVGHGVWMERLQVGLYLTDADLSKTFEAKVGLLRYAPTITFTHKRFGSLGFVYGVDLNISREPSVGLRIGYLIGDILH